LTSLCGAPGVVDVLRRMADQIEREDQENVIQ
jgi:hypothetical protein